MTSRPVVGRAVFHVELGRAFALGAMYAQLDRAKTSRELAELGVRAGCEFDKNSAGPIRIQTLRLKTKD